MKDVVLSILNLLCVASLHSGACWWFNGPIGQRVLRWALL